MASRYLVNVQILRFLAALLVVVAHVGIEVEHISETSGRPFALFHPLDWGVGVDIFFVISGFIMFYLMHDRFARPGSPARFLRRRLIRIVPLYWICTTLMLLSILIAGQLVRNDGLNPAHIIASYAFIPWPRADGQMGPLLSLGWTLNFEMFFYVVFAFALLLPRRLGLTSMFTGFCALMLIAPHVPADLWMIRFWGDTIIGEFLLGIVLAMAFLGNRRLGIVAMIALIVMGFGLAVLFFQTGSYEVVPRLVTGGIPAIVIATAAILGPSAPNNAFSRFLALGGDASYALYLTHPFTIKLLGALGLKMGLSLTGIFWLGLLLTVIVALLVHLLVERPITRFLNRTFDQPGPRPLAEKASLP
ncbi:acyltransferase family protein [Rhizobium rhizosphaerae]|uniref:acyltransferase family protein n=1 Tax=Xaviernesmea rhizosphaerae TaxID=1672749 RepID=UPI00098EB951|nr:acyltransferase [Xaviernesmea rhizosphaerae]